jgi:hypothetical protein
MLNNDWDVRFDYAGIVGIAGNRFRFPEIVKSQKLCSPRCHHNNVGPYRLAVRKLNSNFDVSVLL